MGKMPREQVSSSASTFPSDQLSRAVCPHGGMACAHVGVSNLGVWIYLFPRCIGFSKVMLNIVCLMDFIWK